MCSVVEFKMENKNRTIVIESETPRDCKSDAEDISVLLKYNSAGKKFAIPKTSSVYWLMSTLYVAAPLIVDIYFFPIHSV